MTSLLQSTRPSDLLEDYRALREQKPRMRQRDAATALGVSEAELVAAHCGHGMHRLNIDWPAFLPRLEAVGDLMALTRNPWAVLEHHGVYQKMHLSQRGGVALGPEIDLRLFFEHWNSAFSHYDSSTGRRSLQVFDRYGIAVHKIYVVETTDADAFEALLKEHHAADQGQRLCVDEAPPITPVALPENLDTHAFLEGWATLQDTHDYFPLLKKFGMPRLAAMEVAEGRFTRRVPVTSAERLLRWSTEAPRNIMIFVPNRGMIQIHSGPVQRFARLGSWCNILDPRMNFHLNMEGVHHAWVVEKPTKDGIVSSFELYDNCGETVALFFSKRHEGEREASWWKEGLAQL